MFLPAHATADLKELLEQDGVTVQDLLPTLNQHATPLFYLVRDDNEIAYAIYHEHLPYIGASIDADMESLSREECIKTLMIYGNLFIESMATYSETGRFSLIAKNTTPSMVTSVKGQTTDEIKSAILDYWILVCREANVFSTVQKIAVQMDGGEDSTELGEFMSGKKMLPHQLLDLTCHSFINVLRYHIFPVEMPWILFEGLWASAMLLGLNEEVNARFYKPLFIPAMEEQKIKVGKTVNVVYNLVVRRFTGFTVQWTSQKLGYNIIDGCIFPIIAHFASHIGVFDTKSKAFKTTMASVSHGQYRDLPQLEKQVLLLASTYYFAAIVQSVLAANKMFSVTTNQLQSCQNRTLLKSELLPALINEFRTRQKKDIMHLIDFKMGMKQSNHANSLIFVALPSLNYAVPETVGSQYGMVNLVNKSDTIGIYFRRTDNVKFRKMIHEMYPMCTLPPVNLQEIDRGVLRVIGLWSNYNSTEYTELGNVKGKEDAGPRGMYMLQDLYGQSDKPIAKYTIKTQFIGHGVISHIASLKLSLISAYATLLVEAVYAHGTTVAGLSHTSGALKKLGCNVGEMMSTMENFFTAFKTNKLFIRTTPINKDAAEQLNSFTDLIVDHTNLKGNMFINSKYVSKQNLNNLPWCRENQELIECKSVSPFVRQLLENVDIKNMVMAALTQNRGSVYLRPYFFNLSELNIPIPTLVMDERFVKGAMSTEIKMVYFKGQVVAPRFNLQPYDFGKGYKITLERACEMYTKDVYSWQGFDGIDDSKTTPHKVMHYVDYIADVLELKTITISMLNACDFSESLYKMCLNVLESKAIEVLYDEEPVYAQPKINRKRHHTADSTDEDMKQKYDPDLFLAD